MGNYLNPGDELFRKAINSEIYVDKSLLIKEINKVIDTEQRYVCVSRPRRFGKSITLNMLSAYYETSDDEEKQRNLFSDLLIAKQTDGMEFLGKFNVICLNMMDFLSRSTNIDEMINLLEKRVSLDLNNMFKEYINDEDDLIWKLQDIFNKTKKGFVILIDEWDCVFREYKDAHREQERYLDYLRNLLKDKAYISLAYMTGILPIKKYGTHSAINMFTEYSMTDPGNLAQYVGFTTGEVKELCSRYNMNFDDAREWYNGYSFAGPVEIYSPKSVVDAMHFRKFEDYWNKTETYEALRIYIEMDYKGLREKVKRMLVGEEVDINCGKFTNDMTTFADADDVFTLMVHLGYLSYDSDKRTVRIPNKEVRMEFYNAIQGAEWTDVIDAIQSSKELLEAIWSMEDDVVAAEIDRVHQETSILQYNDENALSYVISLALYSAKEYYNAIRELPSGKGFADIAYMPKKKYNEKPALIVELKWDKSADSAIKQIKEKRYAGALQDYLNNLYLVGINYNKDSKKHECIIEKF